VIAVAAAWLALSLDCCRPVDEHRDGGEVLDAGRDVHAADSGLEERGSALDPRDPKAAGSALTTGVTYLFRSAVQLDEDRDRRHVLEPGGTFDRNFLPSGARK
jgi:hypothetical protein